MREVWLEWEELERTLEKIPSVRVCLMGDACLDLYWFADMRRSRLSRETPHFPLPVVREEAAPGAAGNVAMNLRALGARVTLLSFGGEDWRYPVLSRLFEDAGIGTDCLFRFPGSVTPAYCKPVRMGISSVRYEDPRLDFENLRLLGCDEEQALVRALEAAAERCDVIAVSDQFEHGAVTPLVRETLMELGSAGHTVIVDSRDRLALYRQVIVKPNEVEAARAVELEDGGSADPARYAPAARALAERTGKPAVITLGEAGALWCDGGEVVLAPARRAEPPVDIVGAGDSFLSAFAAACAAGLAGEKALAFANLAAGVTVKKIGQTGTASPDEIREQWRSYANAD